MDKFALDALTIEPVQGVDTSTLLLRWRGRSHHRQPGNVLGPYLSAAVREASDASALLEMRFDELEYFNSATVMAIIQCVHAARSNKVRLRLVYDDALEWQRLSFDPMHVFTRDGLVEICGIHFGGVQVNGSAPGGS